MKYQPLCLSLLSLLFIACEKEIPIDYRSVDARYVAEAVINQYGTKVMLTTTQDVTDNSSDSHIVSGATIVITCQSDGSQDTLKYVGKGNYTANMIGVAGLDYQIDIVLDDHHFMSTSTMQQSPVVNSVRFVWKKMLSERMLFIDLHLQDIPDENNYYFMHVYRNNVGYRWAVMKDDKNRNGDLQQLFQCCTQREMDDGDSDALKEGDRIRIEVRAIDRRSYDYLYSMQVMDNAGTNPIANFTGGCLGYFSAYHYININQQFHVADIEEEE